MPIVLILGLFLLFLEAAYKVAIVVLAVTAVKYYKRKFFGVQAKTPLAERLKKAYAAFLHPYGS